MKNNHLLKFSRLYLVLILIFNIFCVKNLVIQAQPFSDFVSKPHKTDETERVKRKRSNAKQLVENGVKHFMKLKISEACYDFIYNPVWRKGELHVFVINEQGTCLAQGDDSDLIWRNLSKIKTIQSDSLIKQMLHFKKGGFMGYLWKHSYKTSYIKVVKKDGLRYILGSGFYPQSSRYTAKMMVNSAVAHFYSHGKHETFSLVSQHNGPFAKGDIYTFILDLNGKCLAHGQNPALIGQNIIDHVDEKGTHFIKNIIKVANEVKGKGWVDYYLDQALKRDYVFKVIDPKTKKAYIICSGYFPNQSFDDAKNFVHKAISFLKANGSKVAFPEFTNKVGQFIKGGFYIFVFDLKGKCLANGSSTGLVGQNLFKRVDQHGKYYVQDILRIANKYKRGIVTYHIRNAFTMAYVVKVQVPDGKFIIGCEYIPDSKEKAVEGFVNKAVDCLENYNRFDAFSKFSLKNAGFLQGDLSIFVYNSQGVRLVNGFKKGQIWRNFSKSTDQNGRPVIEDIITMAINGGGWYKYRVLNADRKVYAKSVENANETFIIGSGYFM